MIKWIMARKPETYIYKEVKPYLDKIFLRWEVISMEGGPYASDTALMRVLTEICVLSFRKWHGEMDVMFAPEVTYEDDDFLPVTYLQSVLGEGLCSDSIGGQLRWLGEHRWWFERWCDRAFFDSLKKAIRDFNPLFHEIAFDLMKRTEDSFVSLVMPKGSLQDVKGLLRNFGGVPENEALLSRAAPYLREVLGWPLSASGLNLAEDSNGVCIRGDRMACQILSSDNGERLLLAPREYPLDREWLDLGRLHEVKSQESLARSIESKLDCAYRYREALQSMCAPDAFPRVMETYHRALTAKESIARILRLGRP